MLRCDPVSTFRSWFHRQFEDPSAPNATKKQLEKAYELWEELGRPNAEGSRGGGRGRGRRGNNFNKAGSAELKMLRRVNAVGTGLLIANCAITLADQFNMFGCSADFEIIEKGPKSCRSGYFRVAVKRVSVFSGGSANIKGVLWGIGGIAHPRYEFEKTLTITYECRSCEPSPEDLKASVYEKTKNINESWAFGLLASAKGKAVYRKETLEYPSISK